MLLGQPIQSRHATGTIVALCPHRVEILASKGERREILAENWQAENVEVAFRRQWLSLPAAVAAIDEALPESLTDLAVLLAEVKDHYPFKRKSKLGPAVRGGKNKKTSHWDCDCGKQGDATVCQCDDLTGETNGRTITIPSAYKKQYNKDYRAWLAKKAAKAAKHAKAKAAAKKKAA